jgi:hypothetical protein
VRFTPPAAALLRRCCCCGDAGSERDARTRHGAAERVLVLQPGRPGEVDLTTILTR